MRMKHVLPLMMGVALSRRLLSLCACGQGDGVLATDPRSVLTQATHRGRSADQGRAYSLAGKWHERDRRRPPAGSRHARGRCSAGIASGPGGGANRASNGGRDAS